MSSYTSANVPESKRVVIDPVTRIEGHLRLEIEAGDGVIQNAWTSTTQYRGIELIACKRDPRDVWAFVERICGVCTGTHAIAALAAVEDALQYPVPVQARLMRDLISGALGIQDHVIHFYQLQALDWVDVVSALKADPHETSKLAQSLSDWPLSSAGYFANVQKKLKDSIANGQYSIFTNGYWGHPAYKLPPEVNLLAVAHYLQALVWQRDMIKIHTILGGKNPHPHFLVGGMACSINLDNDQAINQYSISHLKQLVKSSHDFIHKVYYPDVVAIAGFYKDYASIGASNPNLFCTGDPGEINTGVPAGKGMIKPGVLLNGDYHTVHDFDQDKIKEFVTSAWYTYGTKEDIGLAPYDGQNMIDYTGPKPPYKWLSDNDKYTWVKAPRYDGHAMAVGPNARMMIGYAQGVAPIVERVNAACDQWGLPRDNAFMNSTLGRVYGRALDALINVDMMVSQLDEMVDRIRHGETSTFNPDKWEPSTWPSSCKGVGWVEAPRGSLSHWVRIENGQTINYQAVVPSTWNSSGRDAQGQMGPFEYSLAHGGNHPLIDPSRPVEPLRTIHSYDPCQSCAVHLFDVAGNPIITRQDP
ncbi:MAG: nickel-dependent hydrogenase large subunit [Akkermansia sp.]|nr:nickel-dependent hydrogenase large subunit [Akkermansia sp.]